MKEIRGATQEQRANQELVWHPGEAQADFGEADFIERGQKIRKTYLTLSFPHSNNSFTQVFGGVPGVIVFDNATGVGRRVGEVIQEAKLFAQFR